MKKLGSCCYSTGGGEAEKSRAMPLLEGGHRCLHSLCLDPFPAGSRHLTSLSVVRYGAWVSPIYSPTHDFPFKSTGHRSVHERFASPFILKLPKIRELKNHGDLRLTGTNADLNIGTIKGGQVGWSEGC